ncbi:MULTISPECIES: AlpA family transcriptional regulator [unclassified Cellulophaga]|uniref:helix-turn-helix transcriptional regulator n=1 Tax=unclassified Cellulophaga TaxID=2634405 RepID=UPI001C4FAB3D|nr:helix-turn-helix domain-containing protein [Cellulophaga sp. HaHa_2_1]QXP52553.1 helix-turn-helix domain-containing protein [Cellulophaga sp. HaHa_2_1]
MDNIKLDERLNRIEKLLISNKTVLTFDEACDYTGISRSYMYKLTSTGEIPNSKPNGKIIFFDKKLLDQWLLRNKRKSTSELEKEALNYTLNNKR